jgi:bifunctional non-homologous end joining protein LigD
VARGVANLPNDSVIDDQIVALDETGEPSFNLLQDFGEARKIVFYAFDLLMFNGKDVRMWPLDDRCEQPREVVTPLPDTIRFSDTFKSCAS